MPTTIEIACCRCLRKQNKTGKRLPRGWKHTSDQYWCPSCWLESYMLRSIQVPVLSPVDHDWTELRTALRTMFAATTRLSNWMVAELYTRDMRHDRQDKIPPMPHTYLYPEARRIAPELPAQTVAALEHAITRKYKAIRFNVICTRRSSLPTYRFPCPFPVHNQSWACSFDETNRPIVSIRIQDMRWMLRLKGGPGFYRQRCAFEQMVTGTAVRGELALYERGKDVICKMVAWLPRPERADKLVGTLAVQTGKDSLLLAVHANKFWSYHGDHLRRWSAEHAHQLSRWSDDQKYGQLSIAPFAERRRRAATKYRNRMLSACHEVAAQLVNCAVSRKVAVVTFDDKERGFCEQFPWATFRSLLHQKLDAAGIAFNVAGAEPC